MSDNQSNMSVESANSPVPQNLALYNSAVPAGARRSSLFAEPIPAPASSPVTATSCTAFTRRVSPEAAPMSPNTVATTLALNDDISVDTLRALANSLLATIRTRAEAHAHLVDSSTDEIRDLREQLEHSQNSLGLANGRLDEFVEAFEVPPDGFEENTGQVPQFFIPLGDGVEVPPKWVKKLRGEKVAGYTARQNKHDTPYIADIYASPKPADTPLSPPTEPIPGWFRRIIVGGIGNFDTMVAEAGQLEDWGIGADIERARRFEEDIRTTQGQIDTLTADRDALFQRKRLCFNRLEQAKAPKSLGHLESLSRSHFVAPRDRGTGRVAKRKTSSGSGSSFPFE